MVGEDLVNEPAALQAHRVLLAQQRMRLPCATCGRSRDISTGDHGRSWAIIADSGFHVPPVVMGDPWGIITADGASSMGDHGRSPSASCLVNLAGEGRSWEIMGNDG